MAENHGKLLEVNKSEKLYEINNFHTYSVNKKLEIERVKPFIFTQNYKGKILEIITRTGREIKVTPNHPFLVNRNGSLSWISAENLNQNTDQIGLMGKLPIKSKRMKFPNVVEKFLPEYQIVIFNDYERLRKISNGFRDFNKFTSDDFNILRILHKLSFQKLSKLIKTYSSTHLSNMLANKSSSLSQNAKNVLSKFFRNAKFNIEKDRVITLDKYGRIASFKDPLDFNENIVKWFSFVHSEGYSEEKRVMVTQKNYLNLLHEFLKISEEEFGIKFKQVSDIDYHLNSKPFVQYLKLKYSFKVGNSRKSPICEWVLNLDEKHVATFLRWYLTLEGEVGKKGEITVTQANKRNINILCHLLLRLDIFPYVGKRIKYASNSRDKTRRTYYYISISGVKNLDIFLEKVGLEDPDKTQILKNYILTTNKSVKENDIGLLVDSKILFNLWRLLGWDETFLKKKDWYIDYKINPKHLRISRWKLRKILNDVEKYLSKVSFNKAKLSKIKEMSNQLSLLCNDLFIFDRIKKIEYKDYDGKVIDLSVPNYHNFIGGFGEILLHNTTLTKTLTGRLTLTHSEELKRGVTIRLGYADFTIYKCKKCNKYNTSAKCVSCFSDTEPLRTISIIDAPGHETLMATVLTGTSLMDGALLVIAANEKCPQLQTVEHLIALETAGIKNVVVVQSKIDLVTKEEALKNYQEIKDFIKGTHIENAPIIPLSASLTLNIDKLLEAVESSIPTVKRNLDTIPKMLIARSFDLNKPGTKIKNLSGGVLGGSLLEGKLKVGDEIEIKPGIKKGSSYMTLKTKVTGLQKAGKNLEEASSGGLLGLMTNLDPYLSKSDTLVGNLISTVGNLPEARNKLTLRVKFIERVLKDLPPNLVDIKVNDFLLINVGTARSIGLVESKKKKDIIMNLRIPVCVYKEDRIVISKQIEGRWRLIGYGSILS